MVVAGAEVLAGAGMEDEKGGRILDSLIAGVLRKNTDQGRELNENTDLW